jgi:demethylmenaquinone methyltransferase/2-methoxy-6-polyprenyl-1,4-benzoquinol methylase
VTIAPTPEHEVTTGARPIGTSSEAAAAQNIQQMFDTIAPTYDRANHILSAGIDRTWWLRTARTLRPMLMRPEAVVLDLCCGTGDMTLALDRHRPKSVPQRLKPESVGTDYGTAKAVPLSKTGPGLSGGGVSQAGLGGIRLRNPAPILAADFSHTMLSLGAQKFAGRNIVPIETDALHLPLADASVDLITTAFGFRNLASYPEGLAEFYRVLRPGGEIAILECNQPEGIIGTLYSVYFKKILPKLGGLISHNPVAYSYLNASVERFPRPPRMMELLIAAGFIRPAWTSYTFGVAGLYQAVKP